MWTNYVVRQQGALVVSAMLDFLTFSLCSPYSETTDSKQFDMLLGILFYCYVLSHPLLSVAIGDFLHNFSSFRYLVLGSEIILYE
jgi:hypothetical protein